MAKKKIMNLVTMTYKASFQNINMRTYTLVVEVVSIDLQFECKNKQKTEVFHLKRLSKNAYL